MIWIFLVMSTDYICFFFKGKPRLYTNMCILLPKIMNGPELQQNLWCSISQLSCISLALQVSCKWTVRLFYHSLGAHWPTVANHSCRHLPPTVTCMVHLIPGQGIITCPLPTIGYQLCLLPYLLNDKRNNTYVTTFSVAVANYNVLFLGNCNRLVQRVCNTESTPLEGEDYVCWSSFPSAEWTILQVVFLVPKVVPGSVCHLAVTPTRMPIHQSWSNPALFVSLTFTCSLSPFYGKKHKHYNLVRNK